MRLPTGHVMVACLLALVVAPMATEADQPWEMTPKEEGDNVERALRELECDEDERLDIDLECLDVAEEQRNDEMKKAKKKKKEKNDRHQRKRIKAVREANLAYKAATTDEKIAEACDEFTNIFGRFRTCTREYFEEQIDIFEKAEKRAKRKKKQRKKRAEEVYDRQISEAQTEYDDAELVCCVCLPLSVRY